MRFSNFTLFIILFILLRSATAFSDGSFKPQSVELTQQKTTLPSEGIYTSVEEIDNNEPKHPVDLQIKKYNSVDVYYIHKAKLKLLKEVLAISDGKDLFITIGNFRNKKGFVKTNYTNWNPKPIEDEDKASNNFPPGYYRSYNFHRNTYKIDSTVEMKQQGRKAIYQLVNDKRKQLTGIVAICDGKDMYIKVGKYHNKPAFAKSEVKGKFYYFETEPSILEDEQNKATFGGLAGLANAQIAKALPAKEKAGILLNTKNQKMFVLNDYRSFKNDTFTILLSKYPRLLVDFLQSDRKSYTKKKMIKAINSLQDVQQ